MKVFLSTKGFSQIPFDQYNNDFLFIVGDMEYHCPSFLADFLSPCISRAHSADSTFKSFKIDVPDPSGDFSVFLSLSRGSAISITSTSVNFFRSIAIILENRELLDLFVSEFERDLNVSNVIDRLILFGSFPAAIELIASHFSEFSDSDSNSDSKLAKLPLDILSDVAVHPSLKLKSEDAFLDFILTHNLSLLEFVNFEYLSVNGISRFSDFIGLNFDVLTPSIWAKLCVRIVLSVSPEAENRRYLPPIEGQKFPFDSKTPLGGMIAYLTKKHGGNLHDLGVVKVTASDVLSGNACYSPKNVIASGAGNYFYSTTQQSDHWICCDFGDSRVALTHYSIRSCDSGGRPNWDNPQNWCLEGSRDGQSWTELNQQENNRELDAWSKVSTFPVKVSGTFRMVRLRQTGLNCAGNPQFVFSRIEFFGTLIESVH